MSRNYGLAYAQADAHAARGIGGFVAGELETAVKEMGQSLSIYAAPVVGDADDRLAVLLARVDLYLADVPAVDYGVIHEVYKHLLDEHCVHRQKDHRLRNGDGDRDVVMALFESHDRFAQDFFKDLIVLRDAAHICAVHARYGQEVLHHAAEPFGVLLGVKQQLIFLLLGQNLVTLKHCGYRTAYGRQRCAQVVRYRAQEVCPHLLSLRLHVQLFLRLEAGGERRSGKAHSEHRHKRERVAVDSEVQLQVREGKGKVDEHDADESREEAVKITVGRQGDDKHGQHEYQRDMHIRGRRAHEHGAYRGCDAQRREEYQPALEACFYVFPAQRSDF